ncbi:MAG: CAMP factor family pore-forming toxin [Ezakiella sp.]|nr:CAMP factor family pore-forming toxin [Ezakiella sp.]
MKKLLSLTLALLIAITTLAPTLAFAEELETNVIIDTPEESKELEFNDEKENLFQQAKREINEIRADGNSITIHRKKDQELLDEFNKSMDELEVGVENSYGGQKAALGFSQIYDLSSIPQRIILAARMCVAMRFATTALRYKVDQAHVEIAEYIFVGLVKVCDPWATVDDMKSYALEFEALKAKLLTYPDLTLNDTANLYVRSDLDAKLHKARFLYMYDLKDAPSYVFDALNKTIAKVTNIRLRPQITVAELYEAEDELDAAVQKAFYAAAADKRATKTELDDLRAARREARHRRNIMGDRSFELGQMIDRCSKIFLDIRPSSNEVQGLIKTIQEYLAR